MSDRIPIQLRLEGKVKWLTKDRSDSEQSLSAKILVDYVETLLQDLNVTYANKSNMKSSMQNMKRGGWQQHYRFSPCNSCL